MDCIVEAAKTMLKLNVIGSPATCIERIRSYRDAVDLNYFLAYVDFGGHDHQLALASMERFARDVASHIR
jgi:hypothetical protein